MLTHLYIKNYVLIEELSMSPHQAFNVITGETGAGKSIMLGAIGLLLGNRVERKALFSETEKCIIEGTLHIAAYQMEPLFEEEGLDYDPQTIIRREISPSGKSRAFINDTPVTLETLHKVTGRLIDIHSQHDNLQLGTQQFQLKIVDAYAQQTPVLQSYRQQFKTHTSLQKRYEQLITDSDLQKRELDYNKFLLEELQTADLKEDEQETLEESLRVLENVEEIGEKLSFVNEILDKSDYAALEALRQAVSILAQLSKLTNQYTSLHERAESCLIELKEVAAEIESETEKVELDPEQLQNIQDRLSTIYDLQKKHKVNTNEALLSVQKSLAEKVARVLSFDDELAQLQQQIQQSEAQLMTLAQQISARRKAAIPLIQQDLSTLFKEVGLPNATLDIQMETVAPTLEGIDKINLLFSANKGVVPQEIRKVASGGEFSRLMLCIKYVLAGKTAMPTVIFDEIDTGISGEIALKVGSMMKDMSLQHQ
ncbi:MAG: DNA repair protein RecN, partial [Bacteroidota bacterium]